MVLYITKDVMKVLQSSKQIKKKKKKKVIFTEKFLSLILKF